MGPLWVNFRSPLLWDVFAVSTYFTISAVFWYIGLIPDLATVRDRAIHPLRRKIYGALSLGWKGAGRHWHHYEKAYGYLRRHAAWMDYSRYRRLRTPIGSGVTEAACKIVFTQRFKRAGMKWNSSNDQPILLLRVIALSSLWVTVRDAMLESQNQAQPRTPSGFVETATRIAA